MMDKNTDVWFCDTVVGQYVAKLEQQFYSDSIRNIHAATAVQTGMPLWLNPSETMITVGRDVLMEADASAWAEQSLDLLLMPHMHEYCGKPLGALEEAARVLKPGGRLVLTGFNPDSLWRFSSWFDSKRLPLREHCMKLPAFKRQLSDLGFVVEAGRFMAYVPPVGSNRALDFWRFLDKAGDRWWPHGAAVYGLVLVKQVVGLTPLEGLETLLDNGKEISFGMAKTGARGCCCRDGG